MKNSAAKILCKLQTCLLVCCVALTVVATGASEIHYVIQAFLIIAFLFCLAIFAFLLYQKRLLFYIRKGKWLFIFSAFITVLSTVKYIISLSNDQRITFFTVYQIVIFTVYSFCVYVYFSEYKSHLHMMLSLYSVLVTIIILITKNRFMLDMSVYRFTGLYDNPNILAMYATISSLSSLYLLSDKYGFKLFNIFNFSIGLTAILMTASRGALVSLIAGMFIYIIFNIPNLKKRFCKNIIKICSFVFIITCIGLAFLLPDSIDKDNANIIDDGTFLSNNEQNNSSDTIKDEEKEENILSKEKDKKALTERFSLNSEGTSSLLHNRRFTIWREYLKKFPSYCLIGTDYTLNDRPVIEKLVRDPHNTFLYTLYRFGVFGFALLLILIGFIFFKLLLNKRKTPAQIAIFSLFCSFCTMLMVNDLLNTPIFFFILAISYAVSQESVISSQDKDTTNIRVLQVFSSLNKGGAESRTIDIYHNIDRKKIQFDFAVTSPEVEQQYFYEEIISLGGNIYEIKSWKSVGIFGYFRQWKELFNGEAYEIVHAHMSLESGIPLYFAWLNGVPKRIAHARCASVQNASRMKRIYLTISRWMTRIFSTDKIYCSEEASTHVFGKNMVNKKRVYFLPNAIDLTQFVEITEDKKQKLRRTVGLSGTSTVIGTVGNGRTVKNHIFLVRVFHEFLKLVPEAELLIIGDHKQDNDAKDYVIAHDLQACVHFVGVRTDVPEILQVLDLFMLPSLTEGAPGSVVEAQAVNVPCILSDSITRSVDVGAGLLQYISLEESLSVWAKEMLTCCRMERPDRAQTLELLKKSGYEIHSSVKKLLAIYGL